MLTVNKLAGFLFVGLLLFSGTSVAQGAATDPDAESPAGTIYRLPLDSGREDAAPKRPARSRSGAPQSAGSQDGGGQGSTRPRSAIRSENGFGSSTSVPGADDSAGGVEMSGTGGGGGSGSGSASGQGGSPSGGDAASRSGGSNSAAGDAAPSPAAAQARTTRADVDSGPSGLVTYGLLALVIAAGIAGGLVTRMRRRKPG